MSWKTESCRHDVMTEEVLPKGLLCVLLKERTGAEGRRPHPSEHPGQWFTGFTWEIPSALGDSLERSTEMPGCPPLKQMSAAGRRWWLTRSQKRYRCLPGYFVSITSLHVLIGHKKRKWSVSIPKIFYSIPSSHQKKKKTLKHVFHWF